VRLLFPCSVRLLRATAADPCLLEFSTVHRSGKIANPNDCMFASSTHVQACHILSESMMQNIDPIGGSEKEPRCDETRRMLPVCRVHRSIFRTHRYTDRAYCHCYSISDSKVSAKSSLQQTVSVDLETRSRQNRLPTPAPMDRISQRYENLQPPRCLLFTQCVLGSHTCSGAAKVFGESSARPPLAPLCNHSRGFATWCCGAKLFL